MLAGAEADLGQVNPTKSQVEMVRSELFKVSCLQFLYQTIMTHYDLTAATVFFLYFPGGLRRLQKDNKQKLTITT